MNEEIPMVFFAPDYDLRVFSEKNILRCNDENGFNCGNKPPLYFTTAMAEEVGEVCGVVKKLDRGFNRREFKKTKAKLIEMNRPKAMTTEHTTFTEIEALDENHAEHWAYVKEIWENWKKRQLAEEMADLYTYMDLMATKHGINMWEALRTKFNKVSGEMGVPYSL